MRSCLDTELSQADIFVDVGRVAPQEDQLILRVPEALQLDVAELDVSRINVEVHRTSHVKVDASRVTNHRIPDCRKINTFL